MEHHSFNPSGRWRNLRWAGIFFCVFSSSQSARASDVLFSEPIPVSVHFPSNYSYLSWSPIKMGDFNRDGNTDLLLLPVSSNDTWIAILPGKGDGTFQSDAVLSDVNTRSSSTALGDFNEDGVTDIAASVSGGVNVLIGKGDSTFQPPLVFQTHQEDSPSNRSVTVLDLNNDGHLDIVKLSNDFNNGTFPNYFKTVSIFLGHGNGTFTQSNLTVHDATMIWGADFDDDGRPDILLNGIFNFLRGNGDGTFTSQSITLIDGQNSFNYPPTPITLGDYNGDGFTDLAYVDSNLKIALGASGPTFQSASHYSIDENIANATSDDVNGDGRIDIIFLRTYSQTISNHTSLGVFLGNGDGTFQTQQVYPTETAPQQYDYGQSLAIGDLNGDGKPDLVVSLSQNTLKVLLNTSPSDLPTQVSPSTAKGGDSVTVAVNPNRPLDSPPTVQVSGPCIETQTVAMSPVAGSNQYTGVFTTPSGNTDCSLTVNSSGTVNGAAQKGVAPLALDRTAPSTEATLFPNIAAGNYVVPVSVTLAGTDATGKVSDTFYALDNDACSPASITDCSVYRDPVSVFSVGSHVLTFFSRDQVGNVEEMKSRTFTIDPSPALTTGLAFAPEISLSQVPGVSELTVGDFNRDGRPDLVSSMGIVWLGHGDGTFNQSADVSASIISEGTDTAVADFNRDGIPDFAISNSQQQVVNVFIGKGDGTFKGPTNYTVGKRPNTIAVADFNGDGYLDIVTSNTIVDNGSGTLSILKGNGDGTFQRRLTLDFGVGSFLLGVKDFNGDGRADIAVAYGEYIHIFFGNGDATFQAPVNYFGPTNIGLSEDFNGDGKPDLVFYDSYSRKLQLLMNEGDGTFTPGYSVSIFSSTGFKFATADFNGDGNLDLFVTYLGSYTINLFAGNGDGTFSAKLEERAETPLRAVAAADFNLDGRPDIALAVGPPTSITLLQNISPFYLSVTPSVSTLRANEPLTVTVSANEALQVPPIATISGSCIDDASISMSPTEMPNAYSGSYTTPDGSTNCVLTIQATATTATGRTTNGSATVLLDRTLPSTTVSLTGDRSANGWYKTPVAITRIADDTGSGVARIYYSIDDPACTPDALDHCSIYTRPVSLDDEGVHTVYFFSQDRAGNTESQRSSASFRINLSRPIAQNADVQLDEDSSRTIDLSVSDAGGDPLSYSIVQFPSHGSLSGLSGNHVTYTPNPLYHGTDSFSFRASDGTYFSLPATVHLTVQHVNHAPVASNGALTTHRDLAVSLHLSASDADGDTLTYMLLTSPSHGSLTGTAPELTYTPDPGYTGSDQLSFKVNDGTVDSDAATVTINVLTPVLTIGSGTMAPGEAIVVGIDATEAVANVASLDLMLQASGPPGVLPLTPTLDLADAISGWQVLRDSSNPWHITVINSAGISGPTGLLLLTLKAAPSTPIGAVYTIQAASAILSDEQLHQQNGTGLVAPGTITLVACTSRIPGDVNGNGEVDLGDAIQTLRMAVLGVPPANECAQAAANVNCDGVVNIQDAILILQRVALNKELSVCQ